MGTDTAGKAEDASAFRDTQGNSARKVKHHLLEIHNLISWTFFPILILFFFCKYQWIVLTRCALATDSAWRAIAFARRAGKEASALIWTRRRANVSRTAPDTECLISSPSGASALRGGPGTSARQRNAIWTAGNTEGKQQHVLKADRFLELSFSYLSVCLFVRKSFSSPLVFQGPVSNLRRKSLDPVS